MSLIHHLTQHAERGDSMMHPVECKIHGVLGHTYHELPLLMWEEAPGNPDHVRLALELEGFNLIEQSELSYFRALSGLRARLEPQGWQLLCHGACENVYPSPMLESMGSGEKAYRLTLGVPAKTSDLVSIFASGADMRPTTVRQQEEFYQRWLASLK